MAYSVLEMILNRNDMVTIMSHAKLATFTHSCLRNGPSAITGPRLKREVEDENEICRYLLHFDCHGGFMGSWTGIRGHERLFHYSAVHTGNHKAEHALHDRQFRQHVRSVKCR